jgi:hypothetical protein
MADGTVTRATGTQAQIHDAGGWAAPTAIRYLGLASAASESESAAAVPAAAAVATQRLRSLRDGQRKRSLRRGWGRHSMSPSPT